MPHSEFQRRGALSDGRWLLKILTAEAHSVAVPVVTGALLLSCRHRRRGARRCGRDVRAGPHTRWVAGRHGSRGDPPSDDRLMEELAAVCRFVEGKLFELLEEAGSGSAPARGLGDPGPIAPPGSVRRRGRVWLSATDGRPTSTPGARHDFARPPRGHLAGALK